MLVHKILVRNMSSCGITFNTRSHSTWYDFRVTCSSCRKNLSRSPKHIKAELKITPGSELICHELKLNTIPESELPSYYDKICRAIQRLGL